MFRANSVLFRPKHKISTHLLSGHIETGHVFLYALPVHGGQSCVVTLELITDFSWERQMIISAFTIPVPLGPTVCSDMRSCTPSIIQSQN